ncbi:tetratricopeptide repeat protein [Azospirillum picis]|uniref:Tetratricopeptide (TPR) repeat protein n=1 Tax=Azospirillum picis TaxID=488438 RepID=A0ABU0MEI9_9PROT|nr:tetratricopeptide repeat protein [Azospirillum picis]MBP2297838.1 tetratricopeptide (TPR) repeat protein [Azospirillum picis]MDQ0531676.1 tetratricopeptide (TPR) repeat protein [Azospirillum picis]
MTLGVPAGAGQGNLQLDSLFQALRSTTDVAYAESVEEHIWDFWLEHPDPAMVHDLRAGVLSLNNDDYQAALHAFDAAVTRDPSYAEGWNKRASAHYMLGDYAAAMTDLHHALSLEPRHFGALVELGLVYLSIGDERVALRAFDAALAINPHLDRVRDQADSIRHRLNGMGVGRERPASLAL